MANPTTNYGFVLPTPTDLVTNLPADFEVALQGVDTQMKTNADAATQKVTLTTKGDIYAATAASTPARLASSGVNGDVLTVDTSTSTGLKYAASASMTLLATHTANNTVTSYTTGSIAATYTNLVVVGAGIQLNDTVNRDLFFKFNSSSGSDYYTSYTRCIGVTLSGKEFNAQTEMYFSDNTGSVGGLSTDTSDGWGNFVLTVNDYAATLYRSILFQGGKYGVNFSGRGYWNQTTAINAITIGSNVNFKDGTIKIYGVK